MKKKLGNKNEVLSNILHKYNEWSFVFTFIFNINLKNIFTLKNPSTFDNQLIQKPGNWFAVAKKVRITPDKEGNFKKSTCSFT